MAKPLVIIFAKVPRYGAVKTRLARDIGAGEALRFYRRTLAAAVRRMAGDARFETVLALTPDHPGNGYRAGVRLAPQGGGDLGRRMVRALRAAGNRPAIVIGSDIPDVTSAHAAAAFAALGRAPFVLGPAADGGYWLIGARHPAQMRLDALDGVRWSSPHTMGDSIARLPRAAVLSAVLDDIDDGATYRRLMTR